MTKTELETPVLDTVAHLSNSRSLILESSQSWMSPGSEKIVRYRNPAPAMQNADAVSVSSVPVAQAMPRGGIFKRSRGKEGGGSRGKI